MRVFVINIKALQKIFLRDFAEDVIKKQRDETFSLFFCLIFKCKVPDDTNRFYKYYSRNKENKDEESKDQK